jgi:hypothetical protein
MNDNVKDYPPYLDYPKLRKPITKADRIRSMTDEELAEIMAGECPPNYPNGNCREYEEYDGNLDCSKCWLDWLKSPADKENEKGE